MQPITNDIQSTIQCVSCIEESKRNAYELKSMLQVGYTPKGLQVWCTKHKVTVVHLKPDDLHIIVNSVWKGYS